MRSTQLQPKKPRSAANNNRHDGARNQPTGRGLLAALALVDACARFASSAIP